jgi:predicted PhzF superfamily epimerase YddE/YHI9
VLFPAGRPASFEVRRLLAGVAFGIREDPVTGRAHAAPASLLTASTATSPRTLKYLQYHYRDTA